MEKFKFLKEKNLILYLIGPTMIEIIFSLDNLFFFYFFLIFQKKNHGRPKNYNDLSPFTQPNFAI